jgi:hypothetical protein
MPMPRCNCPQRQRDVETPERGIPGQRVLVVAVAQGAVDVENGRVNGSIDTRAVGHGSPVRHRAVRLAGCAVRAGSALLEPDTPFLRA